MSEISRETVCDKLNLLAKWLSFSNPYLTLHKLLKICYTRTITTMTIHKYNLLFVKCYLYLSKFIFYKSNFEDGKISRKIQLFARRASAYCLLYEIPLKSDIASAWMEVEPFSSTENAICFLIQIWFIYSK